MPTPPAREPLTRERVVRTAVGLADAHGLDAVSMRRIAAELGVVPMALYKHVADKETLLDALVDAVLVEVVPADGDLSWRHAVRERVLATRAVMLRHPWARRVLETRTAPSPVVLGHMDAVIGAFRSGGLSDDLVHHAMHALGSRVFGFSQELYESPEPAPPPPPEVLRAMAEAFPNVVAVAGAARHDPGSVVATGCDDRFEFEFGLDLLLDGVERLHRAGWTSSGPASTA